MLTPTMREPPVFTNWRRLRTAPCTFATLRMAASLRYDRRGPLDGLANCDIGAAAAQVRRRCVRRVRRGDLGERRHRRALEQLDGLDHHAVLTEAAHRHL